MPTFKVTLAYDGTNFSGWQNQPRRRTVQGTFQYAWQQITGEVVQVTATSRTDAGVHALGQVVGVSTMTHLTAEQLCRALNARLPADVVVWDVELAPDAFHATYDAVEKCYRYTIYNARTRPLFERNYVWHVPLPLNIESMHRAGQVLVGNHDFASFQSAGSPRDSTIRTMTSLAVQHPESGAAHHVEIEVQGDGFLYNMVRIIVGTLVDVGVGRRTEEWLAEVLAARDRKAAGRTAPPQGLCLFRVDY